MSVVKQYPVLKHIVNVIHKAIGDSKVEQQSEGVSVIKDGNDTIQIKQLFDSTESIATVFITDKKEILYSEDLLETLDTTHRSVTDDSLRDALLATTIIVNDLTLETRFIYQEVKAAFDELSDSYDFVGTLERNIEEFAVRYRFGDNKFDLKVINGADAIKLQPKIDSAVKPAVVKTLEADYEKIEKALNATFK